MKFFFTICVCFGSMVLCGQNPGWLPEGTVLNYGRYDFSGGVEFETITVVDATYENDTDVRVLKKSWQYRCTPLPAEEIFTLQRKGDKVYYLHTDTVEYLLYDFGAVGGDTIEVIFDIDDQGEPMYTDMFVESIDTLYLNDTFLLIQKIDLTLLELAYGHVIIDMCAMGPMFPEMAIADPGCGILVAYYSPGTDTLCFNKSACQLIRNDFNYSPFRTNKSIYYEDDQGHIYSMQLSSQNPGNEPVVLVPSASIVNKWDDCIVVDQFGWAFDHVELYDTSRFDIYNIRGEPITIFLDRSVGEDWICYAQGGAEVRAFVKNLDTATILSNIDSVMTIGFNYTSEPQSGLNDIELQISKSHGIVQILSFLHFPDYDIVGEPYEKLGGLEYKGEDLAMYNYSFLNATWMDVNNHRPGDELHVEWAQIDMNGLGYFSQIRFRYVDLLIGGGHSYHVWAREVRNVFSSPPEDDVVTWSKDTITIMFQYINEVESGFDERPGITISLVPDNSDVAYSYGGLFNGHPSKSLFPHKWIKTDTCWRILSETPPDLIPPTYISELGGPYYNRNGLVAPNITDYRELKYFKLTSGEEWGEPFDFTVSTTEPNNDLHVNVYPNPASDLIFIEGEFRSVDVRLEIFDTGGRLRLNISGLSSSSIDVSELEPGIYFYKITDHNTVLSGKLVIGR